MPSLQDRINAAKNAANTAAQEQQRIGAEIKAMRSSIFAGETTGSAIQDYLIAKFGVIDEEPRERYEAINALLKGKMGELIVIRYNDRVCTVHRFNGPNDYENVPRSDIAILTGDELVFTLSDGNAACSLPIESYAQQKYRWKIMTGTFCEEHAGKIFMAKGCGKPIPVPGLRHDDWKPLNLEIGDEAAMAWIESNLWEFRRNEKQLPMLLEKLGRLTLTAQEDSAE